MVVLPNGNIAMTRKDYCGVHIVDPNTGKEIKWFDCQQGQQYTNTFGETVTSPKAVIHNMVVLPNGNIAMTRKDYCGVHIVDPNTGKEIKWFDCQQDQDYMDT